MRSVLHWDGDSFFAFIEQAPDTRLRRRPVVVGGEKRGVVLPASGESRRLGIRPGWVGELGAPGDILPCMTKAKWALAFALLAAVAIGAAKPELWDLLPSAVNPGKQASGAWLVATNQLVRPWNTGVAIAGRPADFALNESATLAAVLNGNSVVIADGTAGKELARTASKTTSYLGIAFRPGADEIWASEATRSGPDSLLIVKYAPDGKIAGTSRLNLPGHPIPAGLAFSKDGKRLYAAMHHDNEVVEIDAERREIKRRIPVGLAPFAAVLDEASGRLYVSNRAGERKTGVATAPSGKENLPVDSSGSVLTGSLSVIDLKEASVKTYATGLAPAGMALAPDGKTLAVANSHSDTVQLFDTSRWTVQSLPVASGKASLGALPNSVVFRADGKRLYVACGGENSIAVFDRAGSAWKLTGRAPTGWFPTGLRIGGNGRLMISSVKGTGNDEREPGRHNSRVYEGMLNSYADPSAAELKAGAREVAAAAAPRFEPAGGVNNLAKLGIKHVFFLIKENRTYDQVLGDIERGRRDPSLVMYGREVTPNHHALAEEFVLLDNFHASGAISFEGHQWLMMGFVSDHVERALSAAPRGYAWNMGDSMTVSPAGFFWQDARKPLDVLLLGPLSLPARREPGGLIKDINENELMKWGEYWQHYQKGTWRDVIASKCAVPAMSGIYDQSFPFSSMKIPDQIRADAFLERLKKWEDKGSAPNLVIVTLTSDHTEGRNPAAPRPASMVADNDLALGRIVEGVSKSKFWEESLIIAVEDDAQDGVDHISGRRTVALFAGPMVRRGALDENYYTQINLVRTVQDIFGIQPRTRYLATARPMSSIFASARNSKPYTALPARLKLDDMNPPIKALNGRERWAAVESAKMNWDEVDDVPTGVLNRILWEDRKGWGTPYPTRRSVKSK